MAAFMDRLILNENDCRLDGWIGVLSRCWLHPPTVPFDPPLITRQTRHVMRVSIPSLRCPGPLVKVAQTADGRRVRPTPHRASDRPADGHTGRVTRSWAAGHSPLGVSRMQTLYKSVTLGAGCVTRCDRKCLVSLLLRTFCARREMGTLTWGGHGVELAGCDSEPTDDECRKWASALNANLPPLGEQSISLLSDLYSRIEKSTPEGRHQRSA
jgi:hypothetical protein